MKNKYYILIVGLVLFLAACKKFANEALNDTTTEKVSLKVKVMNDKDNKLEPGVKLLISRRISPDAEFQRIDTVRTNAQGEISYNLPYPNLFKVEIDTTFYKYDSKEILMQNDTNGELVLHTKPKFGMSTVDVSVIHSVSATGLGNFLVNLSYRKIGTSTFIDNGSEKTDANGKLLISLPYPTEVKIKVGDIIEYIADSVLVNVKDENSVAALLKIPIFKTPVLTNLQSTELVLKNGLSLNAIQDVTTDRKGNIYISDSGNNRIVKVDNSGNATVLAGTGTAGTVDGAGDVAQFSAPYGIRCAIDGTLYVADDARHIIRKIVIAPDGKATVSTIAGLAGSSGATDGIGTAAKFNRPAGIALDKANKFLYVAEWGGNRVRKIDLSTNTVSTVAGSGASSVLGGIGTAATFQIPWGVALNDDESALYVASWNGSAISKINLSNSLVTVLRKGATTNFSSPRGIYYAGGKLFVANTGNHIFSAINNEVETNTTFTLLMGSTTSGNAVGSATATRFNGPIGIWYDKFSGKFYIADTGNNKIKIITPN